MRPNIILITADQMRADCMGCAGTPAVTPNLDRLAAEGALFENAYCVNPVCTPSRAALFTGRYPHVTGAWNIGVSMNEEEVTFCDHLKPLGYRCVANGKMHFRPQCRSGSMKAEDPAVRDRPRVSDGTYYGFDERHVTEDNRVGEYLDWLREVAPEWLGNLAGAGANSRGDTWGPDGSCFPPELHQTHWVGQKSVDTILSHDAGRPLFLWTSFVDPHHPFNAPAEYARRYEGVAIPEPVGRPGEHEGRPDHLRRQGGRGYWPGGGEEHARTREEIRDLRLNTYAMVTFIDEQVGRILQALQTRGMRENTFVLFTADHGELLGDHGLLYKGPWLYDCLTRVPMVVWGPGVPAGRRVRALMENVDVLPTCLDLLGQPVPYGVQGVSQAPVLRGEAPHARGSAITSYDAHDRGIRLKSFRTERHKLNVWAGEEYGELFDLERDPDEFENRFFDPEYAGVRADLYRQLCHRMMEDEDPLPERRTFW